MKSELYLLLHKATKLIAKLPIGRSLNKISSEQARVNIENLYPYNEDIFNFKSNKNQSNKFDLSIIIPVYNSEKYIKTCLDSIINQKTKYSYEIILINDGSKDSSLEIIKNYEKANPNLIKVYSQENQGISITRNKGLELAQSEYVGFIDNDDFVSEDYIEKLLDRAKKTNADIVKCGHYRYSSADEKIVADIRYDDISITGDIGNNIVKYKGFVWEGFIKRELWKNLGFPVGCWYEDIITRIILFRRCKQFEYISESLYYYNLHQNNASKKVWNSGNLKAIDQLYLVDSAIKYCKENGMDNKDSALSYCLMHELGEVLWLRTKNLDKNTRKNIFILACDIADKYAKEQNDFTEYEKNILLSFKNKNFIKWNLNSLSRILWIKFENEKDDITKC
ncbi:MAG: glycosyltransferase [Clostridia bacterium]